MDGVRVAKGNARAPAASAGGSAEPVLRHCAPPPSADASTAALANAPAGPASPPTSCHAWFFAQRDHATVAMTAAVVTSRRAEGSVSGRRLHAVVTLACAPRAKRCHTEAMVAPPRAHSVAGATTLPTPTAMETRSASAAHATCT